MLSSFPTFCYIFELPVSTCTRKCHQFLGLCHFVVGLRTLNVKVKKNAKLATPGQATRGILSSKKEC